jgi:hypothetical protein
MSARNLKPSDDGTALLWGIEHRLVKGRWFPILRKERAMRQIWETLLLNR